METKGFVIAVKNLGYEVEIFNTFISINDDYSERYATVETDAILGIDTDYDTFKSLDDDDKNILFRLILEYAKTPLKERDIEKKYRYELPVLNINDILLHIRKYSRNELRIDHSRKDFVLTDAAYHFTDKEVEKFTGKDRALFNACEKIEVF